MNPDRDERELEAGRAVDARGRAGSRGGRRGANHGAPITRLQTSADLDVGNYGVRGVTTLGVGVPIALAERTGV